MHCTYNNMYLTYNKQQHASAQYMFAMFPDGHKEGKAVWVVCSGDSFLPMVARPTGGKLLRCSGVPTVVTKICHVVGVTQIQ
jgi:hypothetical protein